MFPSLAARPCGGNKFCRFGNNGKCFASSQKYILCVSVLLGQKLPKHSFPYKVTMNATLMFSALLIKTHDFPERLGNGAAKHLLAVPRKHNNKYGIQTDAS